MIKKLVVAVLLALPLAGFAQKFAVVNTQEVMQALPEVKSAQTQLQNSQKQYDEEGQKLSREFQTKLAELDSLQKVQGTPQSVIERRAQDLETLQRRIQEFQYTASQEPRASAGFTPSAYLLQGKRCYHNPRSGGWICVCV